MVQLVKNPPAMPETPVRFLGPEDLLEKGWATCSSTLGLPSSSAGEESTCNSGDPGSIPRSGRSAGEGIGYPSPVFLGFPGGSAGRESACNSGDLGSIPGLGRSPREGNGYPLQDSDLENFVDYIVHGVTKSRTRLSNFHFPDESSEARSSYRTTVMV